MGYRNIPDEVRDDYLNWLMTPPTERDPQTKTAWAEQYGVAYNTLQYWEDSEEFKAALRGLKTKYGARWHAEILDEVMGVVRDGSPTAKVSAAKLLLQHLDLGEKEDKATEVIPEAVEAIKKALEEQGYKTT